MSACAPRPRPGLRLPLTSRRCEPNGRPAMPWELHGLRAAERKHPLRPRAKYAEAAGHQKIHHKPDGTSAAQRPSGLANSLNQGFGVGKSGGNGRKWGKMGVGGWGNSGRGTRIVGCGGLWRDVVEENGENGRKWDEIPIFHSPISPIFPEVEDEHRAKHPHSAPWRRVSASGKNSYFTVGDCGGLVFTKGTVGKSTSRPRTAAALRDAPQSVP